MGFGKAFKKITGAVRGIAKNPLRALAATTTGGTSLLAPPNVQTQIGSSIASFAVGGAAGFFAGQGSEPVAEGETYSPDFQNAGFMTSAMRTRRGGFQGPSAPRRSSPSSYAQQLGARRYAQRRRGFMVSPPNAGLPPSQAGYFLRGRRY